MVKKAVRQRKKQVREWQRRQGSRKLKPHELDIYHLLLLFVVWVKQGSEPTLATFTTWCWQELRFSYIFEARPPGLLKEAYAQFLYSLVLNCLAKGIPPSAAGHIAEALAAGPHAAAAAALSARPRQRAQPLPAAGQEPEQQQQQQQQHLLQQQPGQLLVGGGGQAALREGQGPVEALAGPQPLAAAAQAAPVQVAYYAAALPVMQQAAAEQQPAPPGGVLPGLPAEATAPGGTMDSVEHPAGQHNGLLAQSQGTQLIGSLQVPVLLAVPVPQQHEPQLMHQLPGEQQLSSGPASPILFPTELDLLESELVALPALSPGSPQVPVHEGNLPEAGHHVSTGHAAGQHPHMAELQLRSSLPADLDELLLDSPIPRLQSTPVKPSNGSKLGDAVPAAQPPQPVHGGAVAPAKAGKRGGDDHEDWLEQFVSEAADVPYPASAAAAGAAQLSQQSAGAAAPPMPSLVAGQAGDVALPVPEPATAPAGIEPAPAVGTTLSKEFVEGLVESAGLALPAGAVLALYCLYCAQPGAPTVKVYLTPEHQEALLEVLPRLQQGGFLDSVAAARQLLRWQALVPGCTRAQAQLPSIVPGGGVRREEAAVVREVKYHLASTLRGLATKGLAQLCFDYEESLSTMWASLGDPSPPRNIADLGVLRLLHEFTEAKHAEAHAVLREGRRWQPVGQAAAGQPAAAAADTGAAGEGGGRGQEAPQGASKAGSSKRAKQIGRQPASATGAAARRTARGAKHGDDDDDDDEEEVAGDGATAQGEALEGLGLSLDDLGLLRVPGATRVVKRQLARKKERDRRTHNWRQHMGVASAPAALQPLEGCAQPEGEDDFDLDMPMLEGLEFGLASEAPPRAQQTLSGRPRPAAAAGKGAQERGVGSSAAGHSQGPAPSSGTEATVEGGAPGGPRRPATRRKRAAIPPIPTPAAVAALGPPVKAKAGAKVADKGAPGTGTGKAAGAAAKRATAMKASPAVKAAGGKKRTAAVATSSVKPKPQKRARFADDAAAHTANGGRKVATRAKGAKAGPHSSSAAGNASGSASPHRPPAAAARVRAAEVPAGRAVAGIMDEAELASIAQQAQQAATLALQALAEDEDYDAQEGTEAQPAALSARTATEPLAHVPPAQPFTPSAAAGLLLGQPKPPSAPTETAAEQGGHGKPAQQGGSDGRQGSTRQRGHQALPGQPRKLATKRRKGESPALEVDAAPGARQLRHKQAGAPPSLPSVLPQVGSKASAPALFPPLIASQAAAALAPRAAEKNPHVPARQPASSGMNGKANGPGAPEGIAAGAAAAATEAGAAATALAAEAAGSPPGEQQDPWAARLAEIEAAAAAAQAALDEDAEI